MMKILVLAGKSESSNAVINAIAKSYPDTMVILEDDVSRVRFLSRRVKKLGLLTVIGQILFAAFVPRILRKKSAGRVREIKENNCLDTSEKWKRRLEWLHVKSVNDNEVISRIEQLSPDIIVVNGTRIISERILNSTDKPFINMHMGITPKYRGVHGAYWAAVNNDYENCGVTIHMVSTGIDTGDVICQKTIQVTQKDNYVTYPYLQMAAGIPLELETLHQFEQSGEIATQRVDLPSKLWSHPTLLQYIKGKK